MRHVAPLAALMLAALPAQAQIRNAPAPRALEFAAELRPGRLIDRGRAQELLGVTPQSSTSEVIDSLYAWPSVVHVTRASLQQRSGAA